MGWVFIALCLAVSGSAWAASFDCHTNKGAAEQTICAYPDLSALDDEMARLYFAVINVANRSSARRLKLSQRKWLRNRDACSFNAKCIRRLYNRRILDLEYLLESGGIWPDEF